MVCSSGNIFSSVEQWHYWGSDCFTYAINGICQAECLNNTAPTVSGALRLEQMPGLQNIAARGAKMYASPCGLATTVLPSWCDFYLVRNQINFGARSDRFITFNLVRKQLKPLVPIRTASLVRNHINFGADCLVRNRTFWCDIIRYHY